MQVNQYNSIAAIYDLLAKIIFFGRVQKSQRIFLDKVPNGSTVLFLGGGSNKSLKILLKLKPNSLIYYVEPSIAMIRKAAKRLNEKQKRQVHFIQGYENQVPDIPFDAILCFFVLDLFPEKKLHQVIAQLNKQLKPAGKWLISDFNPAAKNWQKVIEKSMFYFLKLTTKIETDRILDIKSKINKLSYSILGEEQLYGNYIFSMYYHKD